jgi:WD40 repeat protein
VVPGDERIVATAGDDGILALWNARRPDLPALARLAMPSAVLAAAFTPDGMFIAGATASEVSIWKVGDWFQPRATWTRAPHPGWLSPRTSGGGDGDGEDVEDQYCLCWDASGQKLAYGANSRVSGSGPPREWCDGGG